jgi:hypothetical protein
VPQALLRVGHMLAQIACGLHEGRWNRVGVHTCFSPLPTSPRWGEVSETALCMILIAFLVDDNVASSG